ncbi:leucine--tRNA ligase [Candidatus Beckwithbacteria bacterium]|nr:leucine--tRNA ligase [Candidatus Beckwithbacteria bacterium]
MKNKQAYNHKDIETKWQQKWAEEKLYSTDLHKATNPYFNLMMYPYPSAEGLHVGHLFAFGGADIHGRFMAMQGKDVFEPMGFDSGGIHSENFAIKMGVHPKDLIASNIKNFIRQLKRMGNRFDWDHTVDVMDPEYYRWTQWIFTKLFEAGLAYKKAAPVTWCPSCKTTVSDEQTEKHGEEVVCERCKTPIERRNMKQWFFKITDYADRLLENTYKLNWSQKVLTAQQNWIGKSQGASVAFQVAGDQTKINVFTTRPDTLFGCTFFCLAPEHPLVTTITTDKYKNKVDEYVAKATRKTEQERKMAEKDKTGVFTGAYVINPVNNEKVPVWVADYVLMGYGEGAVMGVPAHDERDFAFAKKYDLEIKKVIQSNTESEIDCYAGPGEIINSGLWNKWRYPEDKNKVINYLKEKGIGKPETTFKIRDWNISRQRYWGPPIPMIYCPSCAESEKKMNVILLHGWYGHSQENWLPWLKKELEERGYTVHAPDLPNSQFPDYRETMDYIEKNYQNILKQGNTAIVGHSLGGYLAFKLAEKYRLKRIVAVAPSYQEKVSEFPEDLVKEYKKEFEKLINFYRDGQKFENKKVEQNVRDIKVFYSDDEPYINAKNQGIYKKTFPFATFLQFQGRGHFGSRENCKELPEILSFFDQERAGWLIVPKDQLPVELPLITDYLPDGSGQAPLARHQEFVKTMCPVCGGPAQRETDVSDTFLDSSWYFLRYPSTKGGVVDAKTAQSNAFDPKLTKKWLPVSQYCGGAEHSVLHLLYSRFVTMALYDLGYLDFEEPFPNFYAHGMIIKDGAKMSKSRGNVVDPDQYLDRYGADVIRLYMGFMGPYSDGGDFRDTGIAGMERFVKRFWNFIHTHQNKTLNDENLLKTIQSEQQQLIKRATSGIKRFKYNTSIAAIMEFMNFLEKTIQEHPNNFKDIKETTEEISNPFKQALTTMILLIAPLAPHISEELWQQLHGNSKEFISVHQQAWPKYQADLIVKGESTIVVQINGKLRASFSVSMEKTTEKKYLLEKARAIPAIAKHLDGKEVRREIVVPGKLVNFVI